MIAAQHTQSLADFRQKAAETLERLNRTGEAEVLTVDGEARAVLLAPAVYDALAREATLARDAAAVRRALDEHHAGQGRPADAFLGELRDRLVAKRSAMRPT